MFLKNIDNTACCSGKYISLNGRIWISEYPYPVNEEGLLSDKEELYIKGRKLNGYEISNYKYIHGNIKIRDVFPTKEVTFAEFIRTLQKMVEEASKTFGKTTCLSSKETYHQGTGIIMPSKKQNRPAVWFSSKEVFDKYHELVQKVHCEKTANRKRLKDAILAIFGETAIFVSGPNKIFYTKDLLEQNDVVNYIATSQHKRLSRHIRPNIIYRDGLFAMYDEPVKLYSPARVPHNAFIIGIDHKPMYIQFTSKGILITNGVFFAKEPLEEVKKPWYIVEKTEDGWDIFILEHFPRPYHGIPRVIHIIAGRNRKVIYEKGTIISNNLLDVSNDSKNTLFYSKNLKVFDEGELLLCKEFYSKYHIEKEMLERVKYEIHKKTIYVPLYELHKGFIV